MAIRDIDRTTTHFCDGMRRDAEYFAAQGRDMNTCSCGNVIPQRFTQYALICQECRNECLDASDVRTDTRCSWCNDLLEGQTD